MSVIEPALLVKTTCSASSGAMRSILEFTSLTLQVVFQKNVRLGAPIRLGVYISVKQTIRPSGKRTYESKTPGNEGNTSSSGPFSIAILGLSKCEQLLDSWEVFWFGPILWLPANRPKPNIEGPQLWYTFSKAHHSWFYSFTSVGVQTLI